MLIKFNRHLIKLLDGFSVVALFTTLVSMAMIYAFL